jgi:CRP-like cAMP-binding protein
MQFSDQYIEFCLEGNESIFKRLSLREKEILDQYHTVDFIKKGEGVFREGEKAKGAFFLASGKVKLYKVGVGGREQILRILKPSDTIGFTSLLSEKKWLFSAVAITETIICELEKISLLKILKKNNDLSLKLAEILGNELLISYNRIISLTQKHVRARLVETLLILIDTYGYEDDGKTLAASIPRDDIAHFSNMTTSNAIRTMSELSSEGIIELHGRKVTVPDIEILKSISENG